MDFSVDGTLVGSDSSAPYSATWNTDGTVSNDGPIVSFTFDDGNASEYTDYYPILAAAGMPATAFVITDDIGSASDKLSLTQLKDLQSHGWEISSHTSDHWAGLSANPPAAEIEPSIAAAKTWLDNNGFPNSGFASPNSISSDAITSVVKRYHPYNRCSFGTETLPVVDPYALKTVVLDYANIADINAALDQVQADKGWVIFTDHGWEVPTQFAQIVSDIKARGMKVKTVRDVITAGSLGAGTHTVTATANDAACRAEPQFRERHNVHVVVDHNIGGREPLLYRRNDGVTIPSGHDRRRNQCACGKVDRTWDANTQTIQALRPEPVPFEHPLQQGAGTSQNPDRPVLDGCRLRMMSQEGAGEVRDGNIDARSTDIKTGDQR